MEDLEAERRKKEMETLLGELDRVVKTIGSAEPVTGKEIGREEEEKIQAIKEMQTAIQEKRGMIETALREIREGTQTIKELEAKGLDKKETITKIKEIQERLKERKAYLEIAMKEMEELKKKYEKYR